MKIRTKIFLITMLIIGISVPSLVGTLYFFSSTNLKLQTFNNLESSTKNKANWINSYLDSKRGEIGVLSSSPSVRELLEENRIISELQIAKKSIKQIARDTAKETEVFVKSNPNKTIKNLQADPDFQKIVLKTVGETGYTCIYEAETGIMRLHPNSKLIDKEMSFLKDELPSWWKIFEPSLSGIEISGRYDWLEADGSIKEKFMTMTPVNEKLGDATLMIAATTYLDEYKEKSVPEIIEKKDSFGKDAVKNKAQSVAKQIEIYIKSNPTKTIKDLQADEYFQEIAVQLVGETGYTAITDADTLTARFHVNPKIVDLDLHNLAEKLPGFWKIMSETEGGKEAYGMYDWEEADGTIKQKYMHIWPVDGKTADKVQLHVAATTYLDEYYYINEILQDVAAEYINNFAESYSYHDITLITREGNLWWSTDKKAEIGENLNSPSIKDSLLSSTYNKIKEKKEITFSDYIFDSDLNESVFYISAPVYSEIGSSFIGVIIVKMSTSEINKIMDDRTGLGDTGKTYLIGSDYLIRSGEIEEKAITDNSKACFEDTENRQSLRWYDNKDISFLGTHLLIPSTHWCLIAEMTKKEAMTTVNEMFGFFLVVGFGSIIGALILAIWFGKKLSDPIVALHKGTEIIEKGNLDHKVAIDRDDEIGMLSRSFDKMTASIKKSRTEIDKKVEKQTEKIREQQDKILAILTNFADPIIFVDDENKINLINPAAQEILKLHKSDLGKTISPKNSYSMNNFKDIIPVEYTVDELIEEEDKFEEVKLEHNGQEKTYRTKTTKVCSSTKDCYGYIKVFYDLTREKTIDKLKSEFISIAAHQLRTPLTAIKWVIKMLLDGDSGSLNDGQTELLNKGYESNERIITLVNDLLNVSRIEEGRFGYKFKKTNFEEILAIVLSNTEQIVKQNKQVLDINKPENIPEIYMDPERIILALQNILDNAIKYTPENGKIKINIEVGKKYLRVNIKDSGVGIPEKDKVKIFSKFFRARNVLRMETEGTGLGLFISKNIIDKHKGQIYINSEEGVGTEVGFSLPL